MNCQTYDRILQIVNNVKFPGYNFELDVGGYGNDFYYVQVYYDEPDVMTGINETQYGRKWLIEPDATEGQIVSTLFKAILTSLEHRCREHFTYRQVPVFCPHFDINDLVDLNETHKVRELTNSDEIPF
jgi:hypothetical protein